MPSFETKLVVVSLRSVATVIACSFIGAYARRQGVLDAKAQKVIDKLVSSVLLPTLILGKVTPSLSFAGLLLIWPMAVMCICVVIFGLTCGWLLASTLSFRHPGPAAKYKGLMMVALAFPNSFSVPMTLALALGDHPVLLSSVEAGGEHLSQRIKMLFLLSYAIWVFARWSIGFPILSGAISFSEWREKVLNPPVIACIVAGSAGLLWSSWLYRYIEDDMITHFLGPVVMSLEYAGRCSVPMILFSLGARLVDAVRDVWAALSRFGYVPAEAEQLASGSAPAEIIGATGDVEVSNLATVEAAAKIMVEISESAAAGEADSHLPLSAYFGVLVLRQVVGPAFGAFIACWLLRDICGVHDNAVLLVSLLQCAGPPMINLSVMAGLSGNAEIEAAKLLLLTYAASVVTWTVSIAAYLWLLA